MSALPHFVQDQRENVVWKDLATNKAKWLERKIRELLKAESLSTRYVYGYLRYLDKENRGFAYPAQATIARAVKISPRHVIRTLVRLEELGLIFRGKRAGHSYYIFTLPKDLQEAKSPLEANLEAITQEVKELKEKALKFHLGKEKTQPKVTSPCHTNKIKNKDKIKVPTPKEQTNSNPREERKESSSVVSKNQDWFSWIEEKKDLVLTQQEKEQVEMKAQEILESRQKRFKGFPASFLGSYVSEIALAYVLHTSRSISYTGQDCLLSQEMNL